MKRLLMVMIMVAAAAAVAALAAEGAGSDTIIDDANEDSIMDYLGV